VGDTEEAVLERWGEPARKKHIIGSKGKRELWVYDCEYFTPCSMNCDRYYYLPCIYLFFEEGKLTSWHDTR
jgi:hypothetical protein